MFRPVASSTFEEMKFKLYPPRHLVVSPSQLIMLEESRLRPSGSTVLAARLLPELSKLHFKKGGTKLRFEFKEIDGIANATVAVELDNPDEALDCVKAIKSRMEVSYFHGISYQSWILTFVFVCDMFAGSGSDWDTNECIQDQGSGEGSKASPARKGKDA